MNHADLRCPSLSFRSPFRILDIRPRAFPRVLLFEERRSEDEQVGRRPDALQGLHVVVLHVSFTERALAHRNHVYSHVTAYPFKGSRCSSSSIHSSSPLLRYVCGNDFDSSISAHPSGRRSFRETSLRSSSPCSGASSSCSAATSYCACAVLQRATPAYRPQSK